MQKQLMLMQYLTARAASDKIAAISPYFKLMGLFSDGSKDY
jgi:hypothetical protein